MTKNHCTTRLSAFYLALMVISPLTIEAAQWEGSQKTTNGVSHILNPRQPMSELEMIEAEEVWRTSSEETDEELTLGFVSDVKVDDEGAFYLLDSTFNGINVYSAEGEFMRIIGGEGEGPAEFRNSSEFMLMPNGNFGVLQIMPAKVVTMDRQGIPGEFFSLCNGARGLSLVEKAQSSGGHLVMGMSCANFGSGGVDYSLVYVDSKGEVLQVIRQETEIDPTGNINIGGLHDNEFIQYWTLAPDGRVFVSPSMDRYLIEVYNDRGDLVRLIERKYKTVKRSDKDLAADKKRQEDMDKRFGGMVQLATRKTERDIAQMYCRPNGDLWVQSSQGKRDCPEGTIGLFDVFDDQGRFHRQIGLQADYNPKKDDFVLLDDYLFILKQAKTRPASVSSNVSGGVSTMVISTGGGVEDEDEEEPDMTPPYVICYRLASANLE
jgi:hypothetical protein